jgi:hypothetical protein
MKGLPRSEAFERLISALQPWLGEIVIVGGWASQLYRLHPHAQSLDYQPISTLDTDVALPERMAAGEQDIRARLVERGFTEELLFGEDHPPATHYILSGVSSGFYAEFLSPLTGSAIGRDQKSKKTVEIAGVVSQRLRYIEILLDRPWSVELSWDGFTASIRIANPVSYLAQKVLIHRRRAPEDRAKDILYMHDTLEVFGAQLPELAGLWRMISSGLSRPALRTVQRASQSVFGAMSDDIRRAALIPAERALPPERIQAACRYGFAEVFG